MSTEVIVSSPVQTDIEIVGAGFSTTVMIGGVLGESAGEPDIPAFFFSYGDATPKSLLTVEAGKRVLEVLVAIEVPFNGVGAALSVGTLADPDRLVPAGMIDPSVAATYEFSPAELFSADTAVFLFITPGSGASAGNGSVFFQPQ